MLLANSASGEEIVIISPQGYFIKDGDDPAWSNREFDHSEWRFQESRRVEVPQGIRWVRASIYIPEEYYKSNQPLSVIVGAMASSELYWNGVLVGKNGEPGTQPDTEVPGRITARHYLPPDVAKAGENIIAVRISSQQLKSLRHDIDLEIVVSPYLDISHARLVRHVPALILFGAIAASIILFGAMYFQQNRDKGSLWMALTFLFLAGQFGAEVYKGLVNYAYPVQLYRYVALVLFSYGTVLSLLQATLWRLKATKRTKWLSNIVAHLFMFFFAVFVPLLEPKMFAMILGFVGVCLALALKGVLEKKPRSLPLAIGLAVVCLAGLEGFTLFLDRGFFYGMAILAAILFILQAQDFRASELAADRAAAQSARMELELVKKHIQPHFMMNTLGALTEWILENPKASVDMIQVLADEFRLLNDVSAKEKIPLAQEIELCEAHLKIMSYRQDQNLRLETQIDDASVEFPPAIFHTLVENALTHNRYAEDTVCFHLTQILDGTERATYEFTAPKGAAGQIRQKKKGGGLGLAYVEARLEEAWPGNYSIDAGPTEDGGWKTRIEIGAKA